MYRIMYSVALSRNWRSIGSEVDTIESLDKIEGYRAKAKPQCGRLRVGMA